MAKDSFEREIDYLRLSVTDRCNLGCIYCMPGQRPRCMGEDELLTDEEIIRITRTAMGYSLRKIRLTGGEPLLRAGIIELVAAIKAEGVRDLSLTTNGTLLAGMAGRLREAGLDRVNISLDTMDPARYEKITNGGRLEDTLEAIREAERAGLRPIKINMVPIRGINDDEIVDFARLSLDKDYHIRFIEFMPSGREKLWNGDNYVSVSEIMERVARLGPLTRLEFKGRGPSRNYRLKDAIGVLGFISPVSHSFCYSCNRLRITAAGKIRPCLFSKTEVDLRTPMRQGAGDEEIKRLFALAIKIKPEGDYLRRPSDVSIDSMSSIGG